MFVLVSKLSACLFNPLSLAMLLLVTGAVLKRHRPRSAAILFVFAVAGLYCCSAGPISDLFLRCLEGPYENQTPPQQKDAIVVLTGFLDLQRPNTDQIELGDSSDRIIDAIILARSWPRAVLIISGGPSVLVSPSPDESQLSKQLAIRLGIPPERILVDGKSRNTHENALETKKILDRQRVTSFLLITSAFHMRRAVGCFRRLGMNPTPYAVDFKNHSGKHELWSWLPSVSSLGNTTLAMHEAVGLLIYRTRAYL